MGVGFMKTKRVLLAVLLAGTSAIAQTAVAQTADPAPVRQSVDENGVDLYLGTLNVSRTDLSMGDAQNGMSYRRIWRKPAWVDNYDIHLVSTSGTITVTNGGVAESFSAASDGSYSNAQGSASTLVKSGGMYTYVTGDGTNYQFNTANSYALLSSGDAARVTSITRPDGVVLSFDYSRDTLCLQRKPGNADLCAQSKQTGRLYNITSNLGYRVGLSYASNETEFNVNISAYYTLIGATLTNLANGASRSASYSNSGAVDMAGRAWNYQVSGSGITDIQRPGRSYDIHIDYGSDGKVSAYRNAASITTHYTYSDDGPSNERRVQIQVGSNTPSQVAFDLTSHLMKRSTDENGLTTSYEHNDQFGRLTKVVAPDGNWIAYSPDSRGNIVQTTVHRKSYDTASDISTSAGFDCANPKICNKPQWTKDGRQKQTDYTYDSGTGLITSINKPADVHGVRPYYSFEYTGLSTSYGAGGTITRLQRVKTCSTGGWGCTGSSLVGSYYGYNDASGNFTVNNVATGAHDGSLSASVSYGYDDVRNVTSVTDPNGKVSHSGYDSARRPVWSVGPDPDGSDWQRGKATNVVYNADGTVQYQQVGTADSNGGGFYEYYRTGYDYDGAGRKQSAALTRNGSYYSVTQFNYDGLGRPDCVTVRMHPSTYGALPNACDLTADDGAGPDRISRTEYDPAGRVTRSWSGYRTASAAHTDMEWTNNGKLHRVYNPVNDSNQRGSATTYEYDGLDRLQFTCFNTTACPGSDYEKYFVDDNGNVTSKRMRDGNTTSYEYDNLNRLTKMTPPSITWEDGPITYDYDNLDHPLQAIDVTHGHNIMFEYDALGRVKKETGPWSHTDFGYDLAGNRTYMGYGDGFSVNYEYNDAGQMKTVTDHSASGQTTILARYNYDEIGRIVAMGRANGANSYYAYTDANGAQTPFLTAMTHDLAGSNYDLSTAYTYNQAGQITNKVSSNSAYDWSTGVSVTRGYSTNALNQYTSSGGVGLGYDLRGNLTSFGSTGYSYTGRNLMFLAVGNTFYYDALGRLDIDYQANQNLLYAGSQLLTVRNPSNGVTAERYVYGQGEAPIVSYDANNTRRWLYTDERGSVVALADDGGNAQAINHYDEFGIPAGNNTGRFQYTGQQWLPSAGLYYYKARMYSPSFGRFMQTDPIGYNDGINWYNYVGGDPVNFTDPMGYKSIVGTTQNANGSYTTQYSDGSSSTSSEPPDTVVQAASSNGDVGGVTIGGAGGGNGSGGGRGGGSPRRGSTKPLPDCMQAFLNRTHPGFDYSKIQLVNGLPPGFDVTDNNVTFDNTIYLDPNYFRDIGIKTGATRNGFHEVAHARDYAEGRLSVGGYIVDAIKYRGDHDSIPSEIRAIAFGEQALQEFKKSPEAKTCGH
jgi:RHS repeat-associated protein